MAAREGMGDVISIRCGCLRCNKHVIHGVGGTKKAELCAQHAGEGMVSMKSKTCGHRGCTKRPLYGVEGTTKAELCAHHAGEGMVDVVYKRWLSAVHQASDARRGGYQEG